MISFMSRFYGHFLLAIGIFGFGLGCGIRIESNSRDAKELKMATTAKANWEASEAAYNALSEELERLKREKNSNFRTITQYVDRIVTRPVYQSDCIDDDGLRATNTAFAGLSLDPAELDAAVPAARATH